MAVALQELCRAVIGGAQKLRETFHAAADESAAELHIALQRAPLYRLGQGIAVGGVAVFQGLPFVKAALQGDVALQNRKAVLQAGVQGGHIKAAGVGAVEGGNVQLGGDGIQQTCGVRVALYP